MCKKKLIFLGMVLMVTGGAAMAQAPADAKPGLTDKAVSAAIKKGVDYLKKQRQPAGDWGPYSVDLKTGVKSYKIGPTALAVYALLESGENPQSDDMIASLKWLQEMTEKCVSASQKPPLPAGQSPAKSYEMGLAAQAFLSASNKTGKKYGKPLAMIGEFVAANSNHGGYTYDITKIADPAKAPHTFDNSNAQYALLAVWAAALGANKGVTDVEIPKEYWWLAMRHWMDCQNADGGWGYDGLKMKSTHTMTAAGVASLFVCFDNYFATSADLMKVNSQNEFKSVQRGLDWFDKNFKHWIGEGSHDRIGYYYYGVERVGLASGYKYFGKNDWYKDMATVLVNSQGAQGNWGDTANTSLCLLFLIRGQHMVLFNKLQYDGDWRNRPRDLAMLTRWLSNSFEIPVNWQIINMQAPVAQWHDAPMLYIAGSTAPKFTDEEAEKLKTYILQGGTIFAVAEGSSGGAFAKGIKDLSAKMFPQYKFEPMPDNIDMLSPAKTQRAALNGKYKWNWVTNGIRPLVIQADVDLSSYWQMNRGAKPESQDRWAFESIAHLFSCMTERTSSLRHRATTPWPELTALPLRHTVKLARVQWKGNWNPEPLALDRLKLLMANLTGTDLQIQDLTADKLADGGVSTAYLTGVGKLDLKSTEKEALKKFVDKGGTLIVEAAGGNDDFAQTGKQLIGELYGVDKLLTLATNTSFFTVKGHELEKAKYRTQTAGKLKDKFNLKGVIFNDRPAVIFSAEDLTAGLLGYSCLGVDGYDPGTPDDPGTAYQLMRNIVLYCAKLDGVTTSQPSTAPSDPAAIPGPDPALHSLRPTPHAQRSTPWPPPLQAP